MKIKEKNKHKNNSKSCKFILITISSSRYNLHKDASNPTDANDTSGEIMHNAIAKQSHTILKYMLIKDGLDSIKNAIKNALKLNPDVIITTGGTGLTHSDVTIEAIKPMFRKELDGFGELFRYKSIQQIGSSVILTRATAGLIDNAVVFCLPGSPNAVTLALNEIILSEIGHVVKHVNSD